MKKGLLIFVVLAAVLVFTLPFIRFSGGAKEVKETTLPKLPNDTIEMTGEVEAINGTKILVNSKESGPVYITLTDDTEIYKAGKKASVTDIKVGKDITVAHNGIILKSYPGQINIVYRITVLETD